MEIAILIWIACGIVGAVIGNPKGELVPGFILGLVLGPIGILVALGSSGNRKPCPYCKEMVHRQALACPHCQRDLTTQEAMELDPVHQAARAAAKKASATSDATAPQPPATSTFSRVEIATIVVIVGVGLAVLLYYIT